jgi:uncharacterized protein
VGGKEAIAMRHRLLHDGVERTYALVLFPGEEAVETLTAFAQEFGLFSARFTAIGAFSEVTLGYFELATKDYKPIRLAEQVEVASLIGNVALYEDRPKLHAHAVIGRSDGSAMAGHLLSGVVQPTLEVMLTVSPVPMERHRDEATGLGLLRF